MPIIRKEVIAPCTVYIDGKSGPVPVEFTKKHIDHFYDQAKRMMRMGLAIPVPFEHQDAAKPMTREEREASKIKNNAGFVSGVARLGGRMYFDLDIPDAATAKKIGTTIKYISPEIESFTDGNGRRWNGVITHAALTNRPRWADQEPFKALLRTAGGDGAALSLSLARIIGTTKPKPFDEFAADAAATGPLRFSMAVKLKRNGSTWHVAADPAAMRVRLSAEGDDMASDADDAADTDTDADAGTDLDGDGKVDSGEKLKSLLEKLARIGLKLPDDTTEADLCERLGVAAEAYLHVKGDADVAGTGGGDDEAALDSGDVTEEQHGMMLSLATADDKLTRMVVKQAIGERKARVQRLRKSGLIDDETEKDLLKDLEGARFSLSDNDELEWSGDRWLARLEKRPRMTADTLRQRLSHAREEPRPKDGDEADAERLKATQKEMLADVDAV